MKQVLVLKYDMSEEYPNIETELHTVETMDEANEILEATYNDALELCEGTYGKNSETYGEDSGCFNGIEIDEGAIVCDVVEEPEMFIAAKILDPEEHMSEAVVLYNEPKTVARDELNIDIDNDNDTKNDEGDKNE